MAVYSFSQIQVFKQCPLKYRYQYIEKIPVDIPEKSPDLVLGSAVHEALDYLYKQVNMMHTPSMQQVLGKFTEYFDREWDDKLCKLAEGMTREHYTRRGEVYLTTYYDTYAPFDQAKIVMTEGRIIFTLDTDKQLKFRGVIDRLDKEGDVFIINDYKTNKHLPPDNKTEHIEQLSLYALAIKEQYGRFAKTIKARLHYLHFDVLDEREIDEASLQAVVEKYSDEVQLIETARFHFNMGDAEAFSATENNRCRRCPYFSLCPLRTHLAYDDEDVSGFSEKTMKALVDRYAEISQEMRNLKIEKDQIKGHLVQYIESKKLQRLFGNTHQLTWSSQAHYVLVDKDIIEKVLDEKGSKEQFVSLDRFKIMQAIKDQSWKVDDFAGGVEERKSVTLREKKLEA